MSWGLGLGEWGLLWCGLRVRRGGEVVFPPAAVEVPFGVHHLSFAGGAVGAVGLNAFVGGAAVGSAQALPGALGGAAVAFVGVGVPELLEGGNCPPFRLPRGGGLWPLRGGGFGGGRRIVDRSTVVFFFKFLKKKSLPFVFAFAPQRRCGKFFSFFFFLFLYKGVWGKFSFSFLFFLFLRGGGLSHNRLTFVSLCGGNRIVIFIFTNC